VKYFALFVALVQLQACSYLLLEDVRKRQYFKFRRWTRAVLSMPIKVSKVPARPGFSRGLKCGLLMEGGVEPYPAVCKHVKSLGSNESPSPLALSLHAPLIKR
jgi:hypothetical protein